MTPAQPDIEIYLKQATLEDIQRWLLARFETLTVQEDWAQRFTLGKIIQTEIPSAGSSIPLMITPGAAGKAFTSIWFKSARTPWKNDVECGRDCAAFLGLEVRCSANSWEENEALDSEQWWVLKDGQERLVRWG